ncbi:MAG: glycosyltransferase family 4 protein [Candidatus Brocadiia bacterium]
MNIAIASSGLGHVARGIETWAADTAAALHGRGARVTLFRGSGRPRRPYERTVPCLRRAGAANRRLNRLLPAPAWHLGLGNAYDIEQTTYALNLMPMLGRRFDVVHTQDPLVALMLQRARRARLVRAPAILAHGTEEPLEWLQRIEFVQHLAPQHLEEARRAGYDRPGWTAIGNFVDTDRFRPGRDDELRAGLDVPARACVVLSVAAVKRHHKRVDYLIEEVARFRERACPDAFLLVAGAETGDSGALVTQARERLGHSARFLLNQPRERMPRIYRTADVFALCSLKEMMPIALLEATAAGLPALVSTHPVVGWMAGPGGRQVEMDRPGALAEALEEFTDPDRRREVGRAARRHAVENFGKEAIVKQYLEMYRDVVAMADGSAR